MCFARVSVPLQDDDGVVSVGNRTEIRDGALILTSARICLCRAPVLDLIEDDPAIHHLLKMDGCAGQARA